MPFTDTAIADNCIISRQYSPIYWPIILYYQRSLTDLLLQPSTDCSLTCIYSLIAGELSPPPLPPNHITAINDPCHSPNSDNILLSSTGAELSQRDLIRLAFAGDDVQADFAAAKAAEVEEELPTAEVAGALPGWGQWAGSARQPAWLVAEQKKALQCVYPPPPPLYSHKLSVQAPSSVMCVLLQ